MYSLGPRKIAICIFGFILSFYSVASLAAMDLNGLAVHEELGEEQFIAGLYLETLSSNNKTVLLSDQRKRMEMKILTDRMLSRRFKRLWIEGIAINGDSSELKKHAQNLADFSNMLKVKLIKDDTFTIERTFRRGVEVSLNSVLLGTIDDVTFFDLLLRTWIGPVPISSNVKEGLLQAGTIDPDLLVRFENIRTTQERVVDIRASVATLLAVTAAATGAATAAANAVEPAATAAEAATESITQEANTNASSSSAPAVAAAQEPLTEPEQSVEEEASSSSIAVVGALGSQLISEDVFEEEDDDDFSYTAADLLTRQLYVSKLTRWTSGQLTYPRSSLRREQEGTVRVTVTINRKGEVLNTQITDESPYSALNKEAVSAIKKSSPYPSLPDVIDGETFVFTVPIVFALR